MTSSRFQVITYMKEHALIFGNKLFDCACKQNVIDCTKSDDLEII